MKKLYCPGCGEYLEGGNGELTDCSCGFKQPVEAAPDRDTHAETFKHFYQQSVERIEAALNAPAADPYAFVIGSPENRGVVGSLSWTPDPKRVSFPLYLHPIDAEALREENRVLKNALNFCERAAVHHAKTLPASDIVGMIAHHPTIQDITRGYGETPPDADPVAALREEIAKLKGSLRYTIGQVVWWQEYATGCEQEDTEEMKIAKELTK